MNKINLVVAVSFVLFSSLMAHAKNLESSYQLFGSSTDIMDYDVDYNSSPISLHRVQNTFPIHNITFNVLRYVQVCLETQQVCVAQDQKGNCTAWETQCVQWGYQTAQVPRQIELDFRGLPTLGKDEEEVYEISINRVQPAGDGEDWVSTDFKGVTTKAPIKITRWSDYNYQVDLKN